MLDLLTGSDADSYTSGAENLGQVYVVLCPVSGSTFQDLYKALEVSASSSLATSDNSFDGSGCGYSTCEAVWLDYGAWTSTGDSFTNLSGDVIELYSSAIVSIDSATFTDNDTSDAHDGVIYGNYHGTLMVTDSDLAGSTSYDTCWYVSSSSTDCDNWGSGASFSCGSGGCD